MTTSHAHVVAVADVDPLDAGADALAQVFEHQLLRRTDDALLTVEFRTTHPTGDPRHRSRWLPAAHADWTDRATVVVDCRTRVEAALPSTGAPVIEFDVSGAAALLPEIVGDAALEARRLMLAHLDIDASTTSPALSATDHLALGTLPLGAIDDDARRRLSDGFDRVASGIDAAAGVAATAVESLRNEVRRLRAEAAEAEARHLEADAASAIRLERAARRIEELKAVLGDDDQTVVGA